MTDEAARELLGLPVCADGVDLGTVGAVWVHTADAVLGMELAGSRSGTSHYLPYAAAHLEGRVVRTSPLAVLGAGRPASSRSAARVGSRRPSPRRPRPRFGPGAAGV